MLILAFDTTLAACSAAIYDSGDERLLAHMKEPMQQGHAERLAGMVQEVGTSAGVHFDQLDRIAVTTGPGTFTGVRIGLAMARGVGRALGVPVVGISTLQTISANVEDNLDKLPVTVVMDARRRAVYTQTFSHQCEQLSEPQCIELTQLKEQLSDEARLIIGSGVDLIADRPVGWRTSSASELPDAGIAARLSQNLPADGPPAIPLYLRPADAKPQAAQVKLARMAVTVTPADAAYATILAGIHGECFAAGWGDEEISQMLASPGVSALIALPEGGGAEPAGFILLRRAADEAEIITLCVRPNMRRRRIASQLLDPSIKQMKSGGLAKVFLEVRADNLAAKALYGAAGFIDTGLRPNYYSLEDGSRADAVTMTLAM